MKLEILQVSLGKIRNDPLESLLGVSNVHLEAEVCKSREKMQNKNRKY